MANNVFQTMEILVNLYLKMSLNSSIPKTYLVLKVYSEHTGESQQSPPMVFAAFDINNILNYSENSMS